MTEDPVAILLPSRQDPVYGSMTISDGGLRMKWPTLSAEFTFDVDLNADAFLILVARKAGAVASSEIPAVGLTSDRLRVSVPRTCLGRELCRTALFMKPLYEMSGPASSAATHLLDMMEKALVQALDADVLTHKDVVLLQRAEEGPTMLNVQAQVVDDVRLRGLYQRGLIEPRLKLTARGQVALACVSSGHIQPRG